MTNRSKNNWQQSPTTPEVGSGYNETWAVMLVTLTGNSYSFQFSQRAHDDVTLASSACYKSIYSYHVFLGLSFLIYKNKVGQDQRLHNDILRDCFVWPMQGFVCIRLKQFLKN